MPTASEYIANKKMKVSIVSRPGRGHIPAMDVTRLNIDHIAKAISQGAQEGSTDFDLNPDVRSLLPETRKLRPAAVLIPLIRRGAALNVVLTRRSAALKHHPGQIAFPGGKVERSDVSPQAAALRETQEEIGLDPACVSVLGELPFHETVTNFTITPFVGLVTQNFTPVPEAGEVDEVFEVPLNFVMDPANLVIRGRKWHGTVRNFYVIPYGPYYIWGATARMLKMMSDRVWLP